MEDRHPTPISNSERNLLGPAWRSKQAQQLLSRAPHAFPRECDPVVRDLTRYLASRADDQGCHRSRTSYPTIDAAVQLDADRETSAYLKLAVLANLPPDEIAMRLNVDAAVLAMWETIFFDLRDLRHATSWVVIHVIEPERRAGHHELAARMKLAMGAGPIAVRALLDEVASLPLEEAERLFRQKLKLTIKFDEAAEMAIDGPRAAMRFVRMTVDMQLAEKRLTLAGQRLEQHCADARDRHERATARLELQRKRLEIRADRAAARRRSAPARAPRWAPPAAAAATTDFVPAITCPGLAQLAWRTAASPLATPDTSKTVMPQPNLADLDLPNFEIDNDEAAISPNQVAPRTEIARNELLLKVG